LILDQIVNSTRRRLAQDRSSTSLASIEERVCHQDPPRDFARALYGEDVSLIAEVKRASPSKGRLRQDLSASSFARMYRESGAAAISVLTEPEYFRGSFEDLRAVRTEVELPVLCKDFIVDRYQVYRARAHGADAILLIVAILSQRDLGALLEAAHALGMAALVEVHNREELERALELSPRVVGINNRNLKDFSVDLATTLVLARAVPAGVTIVSESGIRTRDDVVTLRDAGVHAVLVGEALVTSADPAAKIRELLGSDGQCQARRTGAAQQDR
jgi:indole-3-glycerol phosphate synthase